MLKVQMENHFDTRGFASYLVGDDFSFSYDSSTGVLSVNTTNLNDLAARIRDFEPDGNVTITQGDQKYDEWGNPLF